VRPHDAHDRPAGTGDPFPRRGLGRGLGALIPTAPPAAAHPDPATAAGGGAPLDVLFPRRAPHDGQHTDPRAVAVPGATFAEIDVAAVVANSRQPRQVFDDDELAELAASLREVGLLQPIVVRPAADAGPAARYELVMGERRLRAARLAGLRTVPAIVRDTADEHLLRDALLENLHRADLNPLEEAAAYQQLLDDFGCTHDELGNRLGRSRPQISNTLRLLKLPPPVQRRVAAGVLSAGHARALLGLADPVAQERLAQRVVAEGLSVRAVEEIVALGGPEQPSPRAARQRPPDDPRLADVAALLADRLDTRVRVNLGQRKGRVTIEFASLADLERIAQAIAPGVPGAPGGTGSSGAGFGLDG
jgi:ParB family chromosome partitioning protein